MARSSAASLGRNAVRHREEKGVSDGLSCSQGLIQKTFFEFLSEGAELGSEGMGFFRNGWVFNGFGVRYDDVGQ